VFGAHCDIVSRNQAAWELAAERSDEQAKSKDFVGGYFYP